MIMICSKSSNDYHNDERENLEDILRMMLHYWWFDEVNVKVLKNDISWVCAFLGPVIWGWEERMDELSFMSWYPIFEVEGL